MVPFGKAGSAFVSELTNLFNSYGNASAQECIALKAAMVMPACYFNALMPTISHVTTWVVWNSVYLCGSLVIN